MKKIDINKLADFLNYEIPNFEFTVYHERNLKITDCKNLFRGYLLKETIDELEKIINDQSELKTPNFLYLDNLFMFFLLAHKDEFVFDEKRRLAINACQNLEMLGYINCKPLADMKKIRGDKYGHTWYFCDEEYESIANLKELKRDVLNDNMVYNLTLENYKLKKELENKENECK